MLEPTYALLDETDSGMDVDAMKTVAEGIERIRQEREMSIIVITHYSKFLEYLKPDAVSVLSNGKIIKSGGYELAKHINEQGFEGLVK